jgi:sulfur carrier protein
MKLNYNGNIVEVETSSVLALLEKQGAKAPYAVAINGQFVPRSQLVTFTLNEGDQIDVMSPIQGG